MELQTYQGTVKFYECGFIINSRVKNLNLIFKEIFKLVSKETKIKDIKKSVIDKISTILQ